MTPNEVSSTVEILLLPDQPTCDREHAISVAHQKFYSLCADRVPPPLPSPADFLAGPTSKFSENCLKTRDGDAKRTCAEKELSCGVSERRGEERRGNHGGLRSWKRKLVKKKRPTNNATLIKFRVSSNAD